MLLFIVECVLRCFILDSFNTSHVTLYHFSQKSKQKSFMFQYITCYSLSLRHVMEYIGVKVFQYITCYSLSIERVKQMIGKASFNTSHVTLYLIRFFFVSGIN